MKKSFFIYTTFLVCLNPSPLWANGDDVGTGIIKESDKESGALSQEEILQKFTQENDKVKTALADCKGLDGDGNDKITPDEGSSRNIKGVTFPASVYECTWGSLDKDTKTQIHEALSATAGVGSEKVEKNYTQIKLGNFDRETDLAFGKLQEHLKTKMNQVIYGDNTDGVKGLSDHTVFYELYRSQVGKNMLYTVSQYCLFADYKGTLPTADKDRVENKRTNLELLKILSSDKSAAFEGFNTCIGNIRNLCKFKNSTSPYRKEYKDQFDKIKSNLGLDTNSDDYKADLIAAKDVPTVCEVNRYMTSARHTLSDVKELQEQIDLSQDKESSSYRNIVKRRMKDQINFNEVVNIGSKEFLEGKQDFLKRNKGQAYNESVEDEATTLRDICATQGDGNSDCESYLTNKEDNDRIKDEFNFRNIAMKNKIDALTEDQLEDFLKEDGMSEENIQKYLAYQQQKNNKSRDDILKEIKDQYSNEINDLQESLKRKLEQTQRKTEDQIAEGKDNTDTYKNIADRMSANATNYAHVIHYTNIVSSFLEVDTGTGSKTRNTQALAVELDSNFFDSGQRAPATSGNNFDDLTDVVDNSDPDTDDSNINMPKTISSDDIEEIQYRSSDPPP